MWDHYKRLPIRVEPIDRGDAVFEVETYYGHRSYGLKLLFFSQVISIWRLQFCSVGLLKAMYIKKDRVSARFARVPGRPSFTGSTPRQVFTQTRTGHRPGSVGSRFDPPGRSGFQNSDNNNLHGSWPVNSNPFKCFVIQFQSSCFFSNTHF